MHGLDGIGALHSLLGKLDVNETKAAARATATVAAAAGSSTNAATGANGLNGSVDQAKVSVAGGLLAQASGLSDVREAKVAALQKAIASGTYNVSAGDVAGKLVDTMLSNGVETRLSGRGSGE